MKIYTFRYNNQEHRVCGLSAISAALSLAQDCACDLGEMVLVFVEDCA